MISYIDAINRHGKNKTLFQKKGTKGRNKAEWFHATEQIILPNGQIIPVNTSIKCFEGKDFGYLVIAPNQRDTRNHEFTQRIWKY